MTGFRMISLSVAIALAGCDGPAALDPAFSARAESGTLAIFSTAQAPRLCTADVVFSYLEKGKREFGRHICQNANIVAGRDVEVCRVTDAMIVEPKIEGPVNSTCR